MKIISVTGTKGKTTIVRGISYVLSKAGKKTLRVDTDGHYIDEKQKSNLDDSRNLFTKAPTVCPGKYLITMKKYFPDFVAVLEAAFGSNGVNGLGYSFHQIGIFSNVFEDHIGIGKVKNKKDVAESKSFIFKRIHEGGYAVFSADDEYVCSQLKKIPKNKKITFLPVGLNFKFFDHERHLKEGSEVITVDGDYIVIKSKKETRRVIDYKNIDWTFGGKFEASVYNLMFIVAGLYAYNDSRIDDKQIAFLKKYKFSHEGGRLTLLKNKEDVTILVDYAHEKKSMGDVGKLAAALKENKSRKTIGVLRLAPDRTNEMIKDTGAYVSSYYDNIVVYDKIDGVTRGEYYGKNTGITRGVGEVSNLFFKGILKVRSEKESVHRILFEGDAIKKAAAIAKEGDVVVVICGDDKKKTIKYIKKHFKASFVK